MIATGTLLSLIVIIYYLAWGRRSKNRVAVFIFALAGLVGGWGGIKRERSRHWEGANELVHQNSNFGLLQVFQSKTGPRLFYLNDYLVQNTYDTELKKSLSMFTYMLHDLAKAYSTEIKDVLCIGLGIGIVPTQFVQEGARVDVVEINPAVIAVARDYFGLDPASMTIITGDGRYFVNSTARKYDAIVLDAFLGDSSPTHLMSREAFLAMQRALRPGGALVMNVFGEFELGQDFFMGSLDKTLKSVFRHVRLHSAGNGNVFFAASDRPELTVLHPPDLAAVPPSLRGQVERCFSNVLDLKFENGLVVTDDYNPIEAYDAANRERVRRHLAAAMKSM